MRQPNKGTIIPRLDRIDTRLPSLFLVELGILLDLLVILPVLRQGFVALHRGFRQVPGDRVRVRRLEVLLVLEEHALLPEGEVEVPTRQAVFVLLQGKHWRAFPPKGGTL